MIDIASLLCSFIPNAFSFVSNVMIGRKKSKEIDSIFLEYRRRAYGVRTKIDIIKLLENKGLCDELVAHCYLGDKTKEETIGIFVSSDELSEHDRVAIDFIGRLFDDVDLVIRRTKNPDAKSIISGTNRANAYGSEILEVVNRIDGKLDKESEKSIELDYLSTLVTDVEHGGVEISEVEAIADKRRGSLTSDYLGAYCGFCKEATRDLKFLPELNHNDALLSSLACCALSAADYNSVVQILTYSEENTAALIQAVSNLSVGSLDLGVLSEEGISESSKYAKLALMMNAELAYECRGYAWSCSYFYTCKGFLNPLARVHAMIAEAWNAVLYSPSRRFQAAQSVVEAFPFWASDRLCMQAAEVVSSCVDLEDKDRCDELISSSMQPLRGGLTELSKRVEARAAASEESAYALICWAAENKCASVFCEAAEAMHHLGADHGRIKTAFDANSDWLFSDFGALYVYSNICEDLVTVDEYDGYEKAFDSDPRYFLNGFALFSHADENYASNCQKTAYDLIKSDPTHLCLEWSSYWVPYAVDVDGAKALVDIVGPSLPYLPKIPLNQFFATVEGLESKEEIIRECFDVIEAAEERCDCANSLLARYCFRVNKIAQAARYGLQSFRCSSDVQAAGIAMQSLLMLSADVPADLVDCMKSEDSASSNIYLAQLAEREGKSSEFEKHLFRAITVGGQEGERALKLLTLGTLSSSEIPLTKVESDSCVEVARDDGEHVFLLFHRNPEAVHHEGVSSLLGIHFTESSKVFVSLRGSSLNDRISCHGLEGEIVSICGILHRAAVVGFSLIASDPRTKAISIDVDDPAASLVRELKAIAPSRNMDAYVNGIEACGNTVYFGIETGALVVGLDQLEFTLACLRSNLPFKRVPYGFTCTIGPDTKFLLGYNAVIVLAMLEPPKAALADLASKCFITSSTARRLSQDIKRLADQSHTSYGKMGIQDDKLSMYEFDARYKEEVAKDYALIESVLEEFETVSSSLDIETDLQSMSLCENQAIDIQTAKDESMIFVTEDCLEAMLVDNLSGVHRCSLYTVFVSSNYSFATLDHMAKRFEEMGATPAVDVNISEAVQSVIDEMLGIDGEEDGATNDEQGSGLGENR